MRLRALVIAASLLLALPASAAAHVEMSPDSVEPGSFTLFTVLSPNERRSDLTGLRLTIPPGLDVDSVADTPGFRSQVVEDQAHRIVGLSWQGGRVAPDRLALFRFTAGVPDRSTTLHLVGVQTFADGSTEVWRRSAVVEVAAADGSGSSDGAARVVAAIALVAALAALAVAALRRRGGRSAS